MKENEEESSKRLVDVVISKGNYTKFIELGRKRKLVVTVSE